MKTIRTIKQLSTGVMRRAKYFDFPIQTAVLVFVPAAALAYPEGAVVIIFFGYLFIWLWQLFSAVIFALGRAPFLAARIVHICLSVIPAFLMICDPEFWTIGVVVVPMFITLAYYGLTAWWTFHRPKSGGFLRHISF